MNQGGSRSRFGGLSGTPQPERQDEEEYIPAPGDDPWGKLAADMNTVGLEIIRRSNRTCSVCRSKMEYISLGEIAEGRLNEDGE